MKKKPPDTTPVDMQDELRPEYDLRTLLRGSVRGKYAQRYREGTNLVPLAPHVAEAFANNPAAVNEALRLVLQLTQLPMSKKQQVP
jgi:hypothetical protein